MEARRCDRPDCSRPACVSLSYRYDEAAVWVGDLVAGADAQHVLCGAHADRLRVPEGWDLVDVRAGMFRAGSAVA